VVTALVLAVVASVTAHADDPAEERPPTPVVAGGDGEGLPWLATREWKFARFFDRVKQQVAEVWNPMDAARVRDPTGSRYFNEDRTTVLAVVLNPQGRITEIKVARSSGLDFLDQTAIDAFEKAQPFVNPPPGLADSRGDIRFTFGFHVSTGGGGFRYFRGPEGWPKVADLPGGVVPPAPSSDAGPPAPPGPQPGVLAVNPAPNCDETQMSADVPPEAAPFFDRVKAAVQAQWEAQTVARERDPTGARYFTRDRCLILDVVLDVKGGISRIEVRTPSGLDFLDGMALDSFRKAQPFADPPGSLADGTGAIPFTFGFRVMSWAMGPVGPRYGYRGRATLGIWAGQAPRSSEQVAFYARSASAIAEKWKALFAAERWKLSERSRWRPDAPDTDPLYANEWETMLVVALDERGRVVKVQVTRPCGLDFLDQLASDSIWQAKAFKDPPRQQTYLGAGMRFPVRFVVSGSTNADWAKLDVHVE
jgi:TonB family protein